MRPRGLTRRAALGAGVLVIAGCRGGKPTTPPTTPPPTPASADAAALDDARAAEASLLASYDAKLARLPLHKRAPLQVERAIHATHLAALQGDEHTATHAKPVHDLAGALRASASRLRRLALAATDGTNAALLASIAASHTVGI